MKIELEISDNVEGTAYPFWLILDPRQLFKTDYYLLASMVTGPFFSREEAENYLSSRRYNFGKNAIVYCASAHETVAYRRAIDIAKEKERGGVSSA